MMKRIFILVNFIYETINKILNKIVFIAKKYQL